MNELFEEYIGRSVRRAVAPWRVHLQHARHSAIDTADGPLFRLKPDIVVDTPDGPIVLDTKWTRLDPREETLNVESPDIYQMQAYAHAYDAARLVLVYPWHQEFVDRIGNELHVAGGSPEPNASWTLRPSTLVAQKESSNRCDRSSALRRIVIQP